MVYLFGIIYTFFFAFLLFLCPLLCAEEHSKKLIWRAVAAVKPTMDYKVRGVVTFTQKQDGVEIEGRFEGLSEGLHGFHIHEYGDCSAADASSAGGHYNPFGQIHAGPDALKRHVGDLGNLKANREGVAKYSRIDKMITLNGPDSILGKSIVIHALPDDLKTQPTGASGARVACGVIKQQA